MKYLLLVFFFSQALITFSQHTSVDTFYSQHTKDKYVITVCLPEGYSSAKKYHLVYMTDGTIGIGDYVLGKSSSWAATMPSNCIIIAIGHTGNWHDKRPRDLIPSDISNNAENNFGKDSVFYDFLKVELISLIEERIRNKKDRVFIGHSFGGLFCLYTLFKEDKLFDRHFAISPSCWANYYELDKIEEAYYKKNKQLTANVTIYVGGLEFLNKVLPSTRSFTTTVTKRNYTGFSINKIEIGNANHFSIRKPAIDRIFNSFKE